MISLPLARHLKEAGLTWRANINDFFAIPDRGLDDRVFVISELQSNLDIFRGWPVVTFHGSAEWALDYMLTTEVVWLPREEQIREAIITQLELFGSPGFTLVYKEGRFQCAIHWRDQWHKFDGQEGPDAYGKALLFLLENGENG